MEVDILVHPREYIYGSQLTAKMYARNVLGSQPRCGVQCSVSACAKLLLHIVSYFEILPRSRCDDMFVTTITSTMYTHMENKKYILTCDAYLQINMIRYLYIQMCMLRMVLHSDCHGYHSAVGREALLGWRLMALSQVVQGQ